MTRVLLVEDDQSLGATLKERLAKEGFEVRWASSKKQALEFAGPTSFDLYIFDVGLPDGTGFELAGELPPKPFIFLTAQGDAESRLKGYDLGAEEYIPKPFHLRELLMRVRHVLENHAPSATLKLGDVEVDFATFLVKRAGKTESAQPKDAKFLQLLIHSSPKAVSRDDALNALWGEDKFPSNRTVDNAVLRLRTLLGAEISACIESVRGIGYRWNAQNLEIKK
ncbi:MAG TPA: response regulator transcription factor [Bdellovibrionales bacterium]|nr:response regulator transcription factor [Bdellovibrionales bacterium]